MINLRPHQQKAVDDLDYGKILRGEVGDGKSMVALAFFYTKVCGGVLGDMLSMRHPVDLIIITTAKKRDSFDWEEDAAKLGLSTRRDASAGYINMTVDSWNNIDKYKDVRNAFFVFDEQRLVGAGAWTTAFLEIARHNKWILLTATPGDNWLDYIPVFLAHGWYRNRTDFKRQHVIYASYSKFPKVERYLDEPRLLRQRREILVEMPYEKHTTREIKYVDVDYDPQLEQKVVKERWHVFESRPLRDISEMFRVLRKVVNSDPSRLRMVQNLLETHSRLIVFYNFDYELEILRSTIGTESTGDGTATGEKCLVVAEWNGHKHESVPTSERWLYLVQYTAGSEGWNCVDTDAMCFYSLPYSYKQWHQSFGRIDRLNTPYLILKYYVLVSKSIMDKAILKALRAKKSFNERDI